jgi:hypothetical protein
MGGLSIAMKINEPPPGQVVNCIQRGPFIVVTRDVARGDELFLYYGPTYVREKWKVDTHGRTQVIPYEIDPRAALYRPPPDNYTPVLTPVSILPIRPPSQMEWYTSGRRTGMGYDFCLGDVDPLLVIRDTNWIHPVEGRTLDMCRGLFVGANHSIADRTIVTTYSGPLVDQSTVSIKNGAYMATIHRGTLSIDGYRHPRTHHGMAQFVNDIHGSNRSANVRFQLKEIHGSELEYVLIATRDIGPGEELLASLPDHRRQYLQSSPSYQINRNIPLAMQTLCVIVYKHDNLIRPALVYLHSVATKEHNTPYWLRWYGADKDYAGSVEEYILQHFRPGWVDKHEEKTSTVIYGAGAPIHGAYIPYMTRVHLTVSQILVHDVRLTPTGYLEPDLIEFVRHKFNLDSFKKRL